jgi:hypothetical protein
MPKRIALVCEGHPTLDDSHLQYLNKSIEAIQTTLQQYGQWTITYHKLKDSGALQQIIKEINLDAGDEFLFYYIGHGQVENSNFYIVGEDNPNINFGDILELTEKWNGKVSIILDACRSEQFIHQWNNKIKYEILTSTDQKFAYEEPEFAMSFFTYHFCRAIEKNRSHYQFTLENIYSEISDILVVKQKCSHHLTKQFNTTSTPVAYQKGIDDIQKDLPDKLKPKEDKLDAIYVHFDAISGSEVAYNTIIYIHYKNDTFNNETLEFKFTNIHNQEQQQEFLLLFGDRFDSDVTIHFIIPQELFLINFKLWKYEKLPLIEHYDILLHNVLNYEKPASNFEDQIEKWKKLYQEEEFEKKCITDALVPFADCSICFRRKVEKMGAYFQYQIASWENIADSIGVAKVALWQYLGDKVEIEEFNRWVEEENVILERLRESSQKCDNMALLWNEMELLKNLKYRE